MTIQTKIIAAVFVVLSIAVAALDKKEEGSSNIVRLHALKEAQKMRSTSMKSAQVAEIAMPAVEDFSNVQVIRVKPEGRRLDTKRFEGAALARDLHASQIADEDMEKKVLDVLRWIKGKELEATIK